MKILEYTDKRGYRQRSMVRDSDTDPRIGVPLAVPDLEQLDWDEIKKRLHGLLLDRRLLTMEDVQRRQADFIWCILSAVKKPLLGLYQEDN